LSSTDWNTFNNKQNALTNPITGTGTTNYLPKFTGASTLGNSIVQDNSTYIDIGGYALFTRAGKQTIINPNVGAGNVVADFGVGSGMGLTFTTDVERMRLTSTGNLGLGVTPSAWGVGKAFEFGDVGNAVWGVSGGSTFLLNNAYWNSGYIYARTAQASYYQQNVGVHAWYNAPSGTAGNAISFTQAMTLNASGNLSIGNTNNTYKLDVTGTGRFTGQLTISNTSDAYAEITTSSTDADALLGFSNTGDANSSWGIGRRNTGEFWIANYTGNFLSGTRTVPFQIASTGAATFSSSVTANASTNFTDVSTSDVGNGVLITSNGVTAGAGAFGGGLVFSAINGSSRRAAIVPVQGTADNDTVGLAFFTHPSASGSNPLVEAMRINYLGNVGIGTTSPSQKLDVNGYARATSGFVGNSGLSLFGDNSSASVGLFVTTSGNVGIGTTAPSIYKLQVNGTAGIVSTANAAIEFGIRTPNATFNDSYLIFGTDVHNRASIHVSAAAANSGNMIFTTYDSGNGAERMRITSGGNVLIGTTSATPANANGSILFGDTDSGIIYLTRQTGTDQLRFYTGGNRLGYVNTASSILTLGTANYPLAFSTNDTERMRIGSDGTKYFGVHNGSRFQMNSAGENFYQYTNTYYIWGLYNSSNNLAIESAFAGDIIFKAQAQTTSSSPTTATERMRITSDGNVGIGTTSTDATFLNIANTGTKNEICFRGTSYTNIFSETTNGIQFGISSSGNSAAIEFLTNATERMRITSGGNVEINTGSIKTGEPDTG
jgi:hypothetical protein